MRQCSACCARLRPASDCYDCAGGIAKQIVQPAIRDCWLMQSLSGSSPSISPLMFGTWTDFYCSASEDVQFAVQLAYHSDWCSRDYVKRGTCDATCRRCTPCDNSAVSPAVLPAGGPGPAPGSPGTGITGAAPAPAPSSGPDSGSPTGSTGGTGTSGPAPGPAPAGSPGSSGAIPGGIVKVLPGNSSNYCLAEIKVSPVDASAWTKIVIQYCNHFGCSSSVAHMRHSLLNMSARALASLM